MVKQVKQFVWKGRPRLDQIIVSTDDQDYFISFDRVLASKGKRGVFLYHNWDKYRSWALWVTRFLGYSLKDIRERINRGAYKLVDGITIN
jgi:hypothetical protein